MRYYHISNGLRGCYMPDNSFVVAVKTRRELKEIVTQEVASMREAYRYGGSKAAISYAVATIWRTKNYKYDMVIPFGDSRDSMSYGVFISQATRADYLNQEEF